MSKAFTSIVLSFVAASSFAANDPHSYADTSQFVVRHVALDLVADFRAHRLQGSATLTVKRVAPDARELLLDTRDLEIRSVQRIDARGKPHSLGFLLDDPDPILGSRLSIELPRRADESGPLSLRIDYRTSNEASALQWLEPAQTSGSHPYMYSQGQAIHTRSWIPLQDTPSVRVTYDARIRTPPELVAVMSAAQASKARSATGEYRFEMGQPIPSYLIALAIGDLKFQALGDRTGVWTEPSRLAAAAQEFADLPRMLEAGEQMMGPYRWDRYDLLVMPHSFAFGGMENPRLSFISPSVVAGDRSLVSVIVHELAHSWSGNLVTGASWNDFWLNEGFTTYAERRLMESLYGQRRAQMEDAIAYGYLAGTIADAKAAGQLADTSLRLDLAGRDPNEGISDIAYEKGRWFLGFLETRFGRPAFNGFLREYFDSHAFSSIDTATFRTYLLEQLARPGAPAIAVTELDEWFFGTGMPATTPAIPSGVFDGVDRTAKEWQAGRLATADLPVKDWLPQEWLRFLDEQPAELPDAQLAELRSQFKLGADGNAEIARSWLALVVRSAYGPSYPDLERYLLSTGRYKLVVDLYRDLARTPSGLELGKAIYAKARPGYHATIREAVERLLQPEKQGS
jgi:leukotriene-A4 hydrolase